MANRLFSILVADGDGASRSSLRGLLLSSYESEISVVEASDGKAALEALDSGPMDLILADLGLPDTGGLSFLEDSRRKHPDVPVLILAGAGSVKDAVRAMTLGAADFLEKPFREEEFRSRVGEFIQLWKLRAESERLLRPASFTFGYERLIGTSPAMLEVKSMIARAGPSDANVLIQGETGTGKELVARALHFHSSRRDRVFIPVDCASLSPTVAESELFGYVKGAFTGAADGAEGLVRAADGGTIFLDEIGELPLILQSKLLRVLQEREVRPVGGSRSLPVNIRVLAATNRDLAEESRAGRFREDLFYRLNVILLQVPPLRERRQDIAPLSLYFLVRNVPQGQEVEVSGKAIECLERYDWPGNIRELENVLRRALALGGGASIDIEDLPANVTAQVVPPPTPPEPALRPESLEGMEAQAIRRALAASGGSRRQAARALGIGEATLYRKIQKYGLSG